MPIGTNTNDTATTPGRQSYLLLDRIRPVLKEPAFAYKRETVEICRAGFGPNNSSENVKRYGNGGIGLAPIQDTPGKLAETAAGAARIVPLSDFDIPSPGVAVEQPRFRQMPELLGVTYHASVSATGDNFIKKSIAAGISFAQSHTAHITAHGQVQVTPAHVPIDRFYVGRVTYRANMGWCWRFEATGTQVNSRQILGIFYFGGPVANGQGRYALALAGTGEAYLFQDNGDTTYTQVFKFTYAPADRVSRTVHQICIKPEKSLNGKLGYIFFAIHQTNTAIAQGGMLQKFYSQPTLPKIALYTVKLQAAPGLPVAPHVTGAGPVWIDAPRDSRPSQQISALGYPASGYILDFPFPAPFYPSTANPYVLTWEASVPDGCGVEGALFNPATSTELTQLSFSGNRKTYAVPAGLNHLQFRCAFDSDGEDTGILNSFRVTREAVLANVSGLELEVANVQNISVTGAESDPSHETCSLTIQDETDTLEVLNNRGRVSYLLASQYNAGDPTKRSVYSEGFFLRTPGTRIYRKKNQGYAGTEERLYPAKKGRKFEPIGVGEWLRLSEKLTLSLFDFSHDPDVTDAILPRKVTDVVRTLLGVCGYADDEVDVPDNPMRLFPKEGQTPLSTFTILPGREIGPIITEMLKNYLGWFLVRDGNAGTRGMWRAIAPKLPPYTNLATFYTEQYLAGDVPRLAHASGTYGNTNNGYWSETGAVSAFIQQGTLKPYVKPPEATAVLVIGGGNDLPDKSGTSIFARWMVNRDGLDFFSGYTPITNPLLNPDWVGEFLPILYVDFTLNSQEAVDFATTRLFHTVCHGIKMTTFEAPLVLVTDSTDTMQATPRPLRYYDPVMIDDGGETSQWLVRNVNPTIMRDSHQMAYYELEAPRAPFV